MKFPHTLILSSTHQSHHLLDCLRCPQVVPCHGMDKVLRHLSDQPDAILPSAYCTVLVEAYIASRWAADVACESFQASCPIHAKSLHCTTGRPKVLMLSLLVCSIQENFVSIPNTRSCFSFAHQTPMSASWVILLSGQTCDAAARTIRHVCRLALARFRNSGQDANDIMSKPPLSFRMSSQTSSRFMHGQSGQKSSFRSIILR